jgi:CHAT domain-containing protein
LTRRGLLEQSLDDFGTIHFATHAVASSVDPRRCAVMLSGGESWSLQEIAATRLGPALVVLSACRTGEGEIVPGEGVVGLSWAFLRAGAHGVTASLWSVEDGSTAELMLAFHRELRNGKDPVAALHVARGEARAARPHPVSWAPFVVVMRPAESLAQSSSASSAAARSPQAPPASTARPSA